MRRRIMLLPMAASALLSAGPAYATETITYTYDALGRVILITISGGPNDTYKTRICYDAAGNRTQYQVTTSTPSACP